MAAPTEGTDLEASLLSFEKLDRASPDLWPEQLPGVAEFAASFKSPITNSPPKWMAELENDDIDMLKELGSLTTANLMEKVRGLQNLAYQLGLDESREMTRGKFLNILEKPKNSVKVRLRSTTPTHEVFGKLRSIEGDPGNLPRICMPIL
ncbi:unnamed protein product [Caretta caretta]